jgi:hypothetical protein
VEYSWDDFLGIDSYNFSAVWEGPLTLEQATRVYANFVGGWFDASFFVNDELV